MLAPWDDSNHTTVDLSKVKPLPEGTTLDESWRLLLCSPDGEGFLGTLDLFKNFLLTDPRAGLPTPAAATFSGFSDTQDGGSVTLVPATGLQLKDYLVKFQQGGTYGPAPLDGVVVVPNAAGAVYAYAPATATRQQSPVAQSNAFTAYVPPASGTTTPLAPEFTNFQDTDAGGSVTLVPAAGVPLSLYRYKVGAGGTYAAVPSDGVLNVGNVAGQAFAYSVADAGLSLNQSLVGASPNFTSYAAPTPTTTPAAPTFADFDDSANTVRVVPDAGVPLAQVVVLVPGATQFVPVASTGIVSVGNVAGSVQAKSLAGGTFAASPVGTSSAFTVAATATAPTVTVSGNQTIALPTSTASLTSTATPQSGATIASSQWSVTSKPSGATVSFGTPTALNTTVSGLSVAGTYVLRQTATDSRNLTGFAETTITVQAAATFSSTKSYTTTPDDYAAKCGSGTSGTAVTKSSTKSGYSTQSAADAAALADAQAQAIDAIVCPVPPTTYDTTLSSTLPAATPGSGDGVVFAPASLQQLRYNTLPNTSGNAVQLAITDTSDNSTSYVTVNQEYGLQNRPFAFDRANGTTYSGIFPANDATLSA